MDSTEEKRMNLQQEIINLKTQLSGDDSEVGDYEVTKTYEARLKGESDPYDTNELLEERKKIKEWYEAGYWTTEMVRNAVIKGKITAEEFKKITGTDYKALHP